MSREATGNFSFYPHRLKLSPAYVTRKPTTETEVEEGHNTAENGMPYRGATAKQVALRTGNTKRQLSSTAHSGANPRRNLKAVTSPDSEIVVHSVPYMQMHTPHPPANPKPSDSPVHSESSSSQGNHHRRERLPPITRSGSTGSITSSCSNASDGSGARTKLQCLPPLLHRAVMLPVTTATGDPQLSGDTLPNGDSHDESTGTLSSYRNHLAHIQNEDSIASVDTTVDDDVSLSSSTTTSSDTDEDFSVSSISDALDSSNSKTPKIDSNMASGPFEPLYSLPIKNKALQGVSAQDGSSSWAHSISTLSTYNFMPLSFENNLKNNDLTLPADGRQLIRTLSNPTLNLEKFNVIARAQLLAVPGKRQGKEPVNKSNTKDDRHFQPLPSLPVSNNNLSDESGLYESIGGDHGNSQTDRKITFKALATMTKNVIPRLSTAGARSRAVDASISDLSIYLPDHKLRVYVGTWNMKGMKELPDNVDDLLLPPESEYLQDVYIIGSQEGTPLRKEWEIRLQENLGPSHVMMHSASFGVLYLIIFVRRELVWFCTGVEQDTIATRMGHKIKTKGALAVAFNVFGTSFLLINSHFTSNEGKVRDRLNDYRTICKSLQLPADGIEDAMQDDVTNRYDRVFWFGDFNFRVGKPRKEVDELLLKNYPEDRKISALMGHDQLKELFDSNKIFHGFEEDAINFLPTYKFDVNTEHYDTSSKQRVPSWTDRILYKSKEKQGISVQCYSSCRIVQGSDHKPVFGLFDVAIHPSSKRNMLPGAQFDRSVYIEANLRRAAPKGSQAASSVCTIL